MAQLYLNPEFSNRSYDRALEYLQPLAKAEYPGAKDLYNILKPQRDSFLDLYSKANVMFNYSDFSSQLDGEVLYQSRIQVISATVS